nr:immunoglobulin heavy chain junction region [Macaca mulatta]MOX14995.1 immunoglobulin heavy chain junction region [Macaca mulatta]MOX16089.1 immunoglobulin heavy chain junction region [Macaca mulatta]MOX16118.1 immunoglobulin heavy chain junction region [Macaca mulatta]MOX16126.1 immunoglobulin heavy chain junction region [Macaca mulatta]
CARVGYSSWSGLSFFDYW